MNTVRRIVIFVLVLSSLVALVAWISYLYYTRPDATVEMFFSESSVAPSMHLVAQGGERSIFGDGSYVIVFTVKDSEFTALMDSCGFSPKPVEDEPNHWRLDLCNSVIASVGKVQSRITPEFSCFSKDIPAHRQRIRVYYDKKEQVAIGISFIASKRGPG